MEHVPCRLDGIPSGITRAIAQRIVELIPFHTAMETGAGRRFGAVCVLVTSRRPL
jgi:hypothetical protein